MCGIAGWIGEALNQPVLAAMTDRISHRGPDGEGQIVLPLSGGAVAALGHRRLSIIDLGGGGQPMASHDGRFTIVFNGEIYNYIELQEELRAKGAVFRTHSDTEVILEAWRIWGKESLNRFRGMFAFALYDSADRSVVLARDPFGKKPIYYAETPSPTGRGLVFGSEIGALLVHPAVRAELDIASLHDYLCWRYVPGPNTFFRGIRKLVPGGFIHWRDGNWTESRYWLPPEEDGARRGPAPSDPIGEFLEVFDESVRLRLRADVPLGAFLSSGLDSTSIVATLAHLGAPEIRTFSVGFRNDAATELDDDRGITVLDDVGYVGQQRLGGGRGFFAAVMIERSDDVVGRHFLAAVESRVRIDLESPLRGVRRRFPTRREIWAERVVGFDLGKIAAILVRQEDHLAGDIGAGIVRVRRVAVMNTPTECATLLRLRSV